MNKTAWGFAALFCALVLVAGFGEWRVRQVEAKAAGSEWQTVSDCKEAMEQAAELMRKRYFVSPDIDKDAVAELAWANELSGWLRYTDSSTVRQWD